MFSPRYARARRRGDADPLAHAAVNVALDGAPARWSLCEWGRAHVQRDARRLAIGGSELDWDGARLRWRIDQRCAPLPRALRGEIQLVPLVQPGVRFALDPDGAHEWRPLAPRARVQVRLEQPRLAWDGEAYLDSNRGTRALEQDFHGWSWSRAAVGDGARIHYEVRHRRAHCPPLSLQFDADGHPWRAPLLPQARLRRSGWGLSRAVRTADPRAARVLRTMLDAPFYARTLARAPLAGQAADIVHEQLDLDRFRLPLVQWMLPFRMSRRG